MVGQALLGGTRIIQYRNKLANRDQALEQVLALRKITLASDALLIVNDEPVLAIETGADGVHLGKQDFAGMDELERIGTIKQRAHNAGHNAFSVGVSCYNDLERARRAAAAGATYVAFGSVFPSRTKPDAVHASLSLLRNAKRIFSLPVVAIGGITTENAPKLIAAGVDAVAVVSSLFEATSIQTQAAAFNALFTDHV
jgi:thiamine-phosphate pyrophosphorylase